MNPTSHHPEKSPEAGLSAGEIARYSRHLILPEVGMDGQLKLKQARVLLIGAGGLGSPASLYLAAAGIGTLGLVDFDVVDVSNLQRQILHTTPDVGRPKLESAREHLAAINPEIRIVSHAVRLQSSNALPILRDYDVVVDGTDNFATRYLVNDACVLLGKPNVYGSIFRFEGQASVFFPGRGPCYRCLYPEPPPPGMVPSCAEGGVLGILPGIIGGIQATETIKIVLGLGATLTGRLLLYDALEMRFQELNIRRNAECPVCGDQPTITQLIDYEQFCGVGEPHPEASARADHEVTVEAVDSALQRNESLFILDVRSPEEYRICHLEQSQLIPLANLPDRLEEIPRDRPLIVHCKSGVRSAKAVALLHDAGFDRAKSMRGGILEWARKIDPTMAQY